ncbi:MAG: TonB-dependent receptor [Pseudomonadota bacterium]|nr:TonB-dependent receptor [Pseudomonadota bacterium]
MLEHDSEFQVHFKVNRMYVNQMNTRKSRFCSRTERAASLCAPGVVVLALLAQRDALAAEHPSAASVPDLTALPLEQLLSMEVYSASKFTQKVSEAPSTVTVITAADIKAFGWRSMAEVLRSVRGLYVSYDRNYSYLGARGFLRPGDYNTRFLLQIDGSRINDAVYDQASIGAEFPLELDLIERIEYVPGPGSSIYGPNAFFGVINVITKQATDVPGVHASTEVGQFGSRKASASYGWSGDGNSLLLAASRYKSDGRDLFFPEFATPSQNNGIAHGLDYESGERFYAKGSLGPLRLSLLHAERTKGVPTASFGQIFNDPQSRTFDSQSSIDVGYTTALSAKTELAARLFLGIYDSVGDYIYNSPERTVDRDGSKSHWWGADVKLVSSQAAGHKVVAGVEFQHDYQIKQFSYDVAPYFNYLADARSGKRTGLYVQDEVTLTDALLLNAGVRYDRHNGNSGVVNPRLALIYQATPATTLKAMAGSAFREANNYELYYAIPGPAGQLANPALAKEHIRSAELALVQQLARNQRLTVTAFQNIVTGLISQTLVADTAEAIFQNASNVRARGIETEYERSWNGSAMLRASYSWQKAQQRDASAINSPAQLAKVNFAAPIGASRWRAAIEAQYVGERVTLNGRTGGFVLANVNVFSVGLTRHLDAALGIYNVLNRRYADPATGGHTQDSLVQDGRSLRLTLTYAK